MDVLQPDSPPHEMRDTREIAVYPSPAQLQYSPRVTFIFRSTVWGIRKMKLREVVSAVDLHH